MAFNSADEYLADLDIEEAGKEVGSKTYVPDSHLNSPLIPTLAFDVVLNKTLDQRLELCVGQLEAYTKTRRDTWDTTIHALIPLIAQDAWELEGASETVFNNSMKGACKTLAIPPFTTQSVSNNLNDRYKLLFDARNIKLEIRTKQLEALSNFFMKCNQKRLHQCMGEQNAKTVEYSRLKEVDIAIITTREANLIRFHGKYFFTDHDGLMMLFDVFHQRFLSCLYLDIANGIGNTIMPTSSRIMSYYETLDPLLKYGSDAYKVIKLWEPLLSGTIQELGDEFKLDNISFRKNMLEEMITEEIEIAGNSECTDKLNRMLLREEVVEHLSELKGLHRHWGHPFTFIDLALERNKEKGMGYKIPDPGAMKKALDTFKKIIVMGFFERNKQHLQMDISRVRKKSEIRRAVHLVEQINMSSPRYRESDWGKVKLKQTFKIGDDLSILDPIGDKASSLTKSKLEQAIRSRKSPDWTERRSLAIFLKNNFSSAKELLDKFDNEGLSEEDLMIALVEKERELGMIPRLFSIMTMMLKLYFGLTEGAIAKEIVPLVPECTMTDTHTELLTKKLKLAINAERSNRSFTVFFNLDFEKWNLQFRNTITRPFFMILDQLFGYKKLFSQTHDIFARCLHYYTRNKELYADMDGIIFNDYAYKMNLGGNEGLRQKGWTLITIAILKSVLAPLKYDFELLGQGDNQVIAITIPIPNGETKRTLSQKSIEILRGKVKEIKDNLEEFSGKFGLPLKAQETWASVNLLDYGKDMFYKGRQLPMSTKRICRMMVLVNQDYPGLESAITSIVASAQAATNQGQNLFAPYMCAFYMAYKTFRWHMRDSLLVPGGIANALSTKPVNTSGPRALNPGGKFLLESKPDVLIWGLMLGCNTLGGTSFSGPYEYLCRGVQDNLSLQIAYLSELSRSPFLDEEEKACVLALLAPEFPEGEPDLQMVISDPYSICLKRNITPANLWKRQAAKFLESNFVENEMIIDAFQDLESEKEKIVEFAGSVEPFDPEVLNDFWKGTLPGFFEDLANRYVTTRSVLKGVREAGMMSLFKINQAETDSVSSYLYNLTTYGKNYDPTLAPSELAKLYRDISWRKDVKGVTTPPLVSFFKRYGVKGRCYMKDTTPYIDVVYPEYIASDPMALHKSLGPRHPLIGSATKEKIDPAKEYEYRRIQPILRTATSNLRSSGWFNKKGGNLNQFLRNCLACFSDVEPHYFETSGDVTGSFEHRWSASSRKQGGYISIPAISATHMRISTDRMGMYSKGTKNYPLHFQELTSTIIHLETIMKTIGGDDHTLVHWHMVDERPMVELDENEMEASLPAPDLRALKTSNPLYVPAERVLALIHHRFKYNKISEVEDVNTIEVKYAIVGREIAKILIEGKGSLPMSWIFGIDIETLLPYIVIAGIVFEGAELFKRLRHYEGFLLMHDEDGNEDIDIYLDPDEMRKGDKARYLVPFNVEILKIRWLRRISSLPLRGFGGVTHLVSEENCCNQMYRNPVLAGCSPSGFPTAGNSISSACKSLLTMGVSPGKVTHVYTVGELNPLNLFLVLLSSGICQNNRIQKIDYDCIMFVNKMRKVLRNISYNETGSITEQDIFRHARVVSEEFPSPILKELVETFEAVVGKSQFVRTTKDSLVKGIKYPSPREFETLTPSCRGSAFSTRFNKVSLIPNGDKITHSTIEAKDKMNSIWRLGLRSSHGPFLYSMLKEGELGNRCLMLCDGGGSTSLAVSLRCPTTLMLIMPYICELDYDTTTIDYGPPELLRNNPDANFEVLRGYNSDLNSIEFVIDQKKIKKSDIVIDLVAEDQDGFQWISSVCESGLGKTVYILDVKTTLQRANSIVEAVSMLADVIEVRHCKLDNVHGVLIICRPHAPTRSQYVSSIGELNESDGGSYHKVEDAMLANRSALMAYYARSLDWLDVKRGEIQMLTDLICRVDQFIVVDGNPVIDTVNMWAVRIGEAQIKTFYILLHFLSRCGDLNYRFSTLDDGYLYLFNSSKNKRLTMWYKPGPYEHNIKKDHIRRYYVRINETQGTELHTIRSILAVEHEGQWDHSGCQNNCKGHILDNINLTVGKNINIEIKVY